MSKKLGIYLGRPKGHGGGIGLYSRCLLSGLKEASKDWQIFLFSTESCFKDFGLQSDGLTHCALPERLGRRPEWLCDQVRVPLIAKNLGLDMLHSVANQGFLLWSGKQVVTVHDLFQGYPPGEKAGLVSRLYRGFFTLQFQKKASQFVVDTESTKDEIEGRYSLQDKVRVVELPLDEEFLSGLGPDLNREGVLVLAAHGARKNLERIISVWKSEKQPSKYPLTIQVTDEGSRRLVERLTRGEDKVKIVGVNTRKELAKLYSGAKVLLNPTLGEGFGLPVLEGLGSGLNVVTGPIDWAEERKGVFVCNPFSVGSIQRSFSDALQAETREPTTAIKREAELAREMLAIYDCS